MPSQRKIEMVAKLKDKASRAKSIILTNYQGLTHKQLEGLKKAVKNVDAEFVVTKNSLLKRVIENSRFQLPDSSFQFPTATLFSYSDSLSPLKELAKTIKLFKLLAIKFGILEGRTLTGEEVLKLATLPAREVLIAQLVGQIKTPIYKMHRALNWNIQKLVLTLKEIESKKYRN